MPERWKTILWSVLGLVIGAAIMTFLSQTLDAPRAHAVLEQRVTAQEEKTKDLGKVSVMLEHIDTKLGDVVDRLQRVEAKQDEAPQPARARKGR
jgi:hypothetical protein